MVQFNVESAVAAYAAAHPTADGCHAPFDDRARAGLTGFLESLHADDSIESVSQAAYLLGVTEHYTTGQWVPIADPTRGAGYLYATPVVVQLEDKSLKKVAYYPRGFARLTWDIAYLTVGRVIGKDLLRYPELVMEPAIAYQALAAMVANKMVEPTEWDYGKIQSYARMWDRWIEAAARTPRPDSDYIPASAIAEPSVDPQPVSVEIALLEVIDVKNVGDPEVFVLGETTVETEISESAKEAVAEYVASEAPPPPRPPPAKRKSRKPAAPPAPAVE